MARLAGLAVLALALGGCAPMLPYLDGGPAAGATPAAPPPPATPRERLVEAIEANGCLLTADNAATIQMRANLGREELATVIQQLREAGQVEAAAPGTIRLLSQHCI
ncbi:MAG: hypothetical protein H3C51_11835 [Rubellimicrobium sp.]|nr:hypothetical protein [Rubellimicrobium sp.]